MQYLVQMRLSTAGRPTTSEDGVAFIEQFSTQLIESCAASPRSKVLDLAKKVGLADG